MPTETNADLKIHTASKLGRNAQAIGHWHEGPGSTCAIDFGM